MNEGRCIHSEKRLGAEIWSCVRCFLRMAQLKAFRDPDSVEHLVGYNSFPDRGFDYASLSEEFHGKDAKSQRRQKIGTRYAQEYRALHKPPSAKFEDVPRPSTPKPQTPRLFSMEI